MTMDSDEKISLSSTMGFSSIVTYTNLGVLIDNATLTNTRTQSFSIPLLGCLNTAKVIPGFITDIEIDLTLNNINSFIINAATGTLVANYFVTGYTIRNVELVCEVVTLEDSGMQQIFSMFPGSIRL